MVPNFRSPESQCLGAHRSAHTSERPFARTHCTLRAPGASALRLQPRSAHPGDRAAPQQQTTAPRARRPGPTCPQPVPLLTRARTPVRHERPLCLLSTTAVTERSRVRARSGTVPSPVHTPQAPSGGTRRAGELQAAAAAAAHPSLPSSARSRVPIGGRVPLIRSRRPGQPCRVTRPNSPQPLRGPPQRARALPQTSGREQLRVPEPSIPVALPTPAAYRVLRLPRGSWRAPWSRDRVCGARVVALGGRA